MGVWFVPFGGRLREGHRLGCFASYANMVKVNGMIKFILFGNHNDGITRNFLLNRDINTKEKTDDEKANQYY